MCSRTRAGEREVVVCTPPPASLAVPVHWTWLRIAPGARQARRDRRFLVRVGAVRAELELRIVSMLSWARRVEVVDWARGQRWARGIRYGVAGSWTGSGEQLDWLRARPTGCGGGVAR
jgi:hypothetical protein